MFEVFRVLLALFHLVYTLVSSARRGWAVARRYYDELWRRDDTRTEVDFLVRSVVGMAKLPKHLVIVLGRERASFRDLVRMVGWCSTAGIPCVSFYDHDGTLRKGEGEARKELAKLRPELVEYINWNSMCPVKATKNSTNGIKHKMRVQLLSYLDGKEEVASLARSLGKGVTAGALKFEEINPELLEDKLELGGAPDPDLALVCGNTCATYGLLPWHIRTTEFLQIPTHHNLRVKDFVDLLQNFAKCQQRYGK